MQHMWFSLQKMPNICIDCLNVLPTNLDWLSSWKHKNATAVSRNYTSRDMPALVVALGYFFWISG